MSNLMEILEITYMSSKNEQVLPYGFVLTCVSKNPVTFINVHLYAMVFVPSPYCINRSVLRAFSLCFINKGRKTNSKRENFYWLLDKIID